MRLPILVNIFLFSLTIAAVAVPTSPQISGIGHAPQDVFLQDIWNQMEGMVSGLRDVAQGRWVMGSGVAVEGALLPQERDVEGMDRSAMIRTTVQYDPTLLLGVSANQSFEHGVWLRLGSEWTPTWAAGTSFRVFYRLTKNVGETPVGVSTTAQVADFQIECAYNKGVELADRGAVQVSMAMQL